jgi:hypothetical protein
VYHLRLIERVRIEIIDKLKERYGGVDPRVNI